MNDEYWAHSRAGERHLLAEHLIEVGRLAALHAERLGPSWATWPAPGTTSANTDPDSKPTSTFARSIDQIATPEHSITRMAVTNEKDLEKERTMGRKHTVPTVCTAHTVRVGLPRQANRLRHG